jgi:hypothetical protein
VREYSEQRDHQGQAGQGQGGEEGLAAWQRTASAFTAAVNSGRLDLPLPGSGATRQRWAATDVLTRTGRALGAGPLGHDEAHSRAVADLTVYLRQHHAERDLARLGELVAERGDTW